MALNILDTLVFAPIQRSENNRMTIEFAISLKVNTMYCFIVDSRSLMKSTISKVINVEGKC